MLDKHINQSSIIDCQYKDNRDGDAMQTQACDIKKTMSPEQLLQIREVLAEGIARTLVYTAISELHKKDSK